MKETTKSLIVVVIIITILFAYVIYLYIAFNKKVYPFTTYQINAPNNSITINPNPVQLSNDEVSKRQNDALNVCQYMSNSQNFMTMYCGLEPVNTIDCSKLM